jgi:hypothetical protein
MDDVEKRKFLNLPELELRPLGRPARSQSLYRLRYLGFYHEDWCEHNYFSALKMFIFPSINNTDIEGASISDGYLMQVPEILCDDIRRMRNVRMFSF